MQIKNFTTMIPTGVAFAASGLVGNCIGMNQIDRAKNYSEVCINYSMFVTFCLSCLFFAFSKPISFFFTTDENIAA
jgi:Na+-driven multidrug efflux pump